MNKAILEQVRENAYGTILEGLESIASGDEDELSGGAYFVVTYHYRILAACELLLDLNRKRFFGFLCKSGDLHHHFLRAVAAGHPAEPVYVCGSRNLPFVDALVAGEMSLAAAIAKVSPASHFSDVEYEDDFLITRFMQRAVLGSQASTGGDLSSIIDRWIEVLDGGEDPYLNVCRALAAGDANAFHTAMLDLVASHGELMEKLKRDDTQPPERRVTQAAIFMKGLAFLRIAELFGMRIETEYPMMPRAARLPRGMRPPAPESWRDPEADMR